MLSNLIRSTLSPLDNRDVLDILVIGSTHERYEQQLCLTGHNFYVYREGKEWNNDYGLKPDNYICLDNIPSYLRPDLILTHVSGNRLEIASELSSYYGIKTIRHTHTLPQSKEELSIFKSQNADLNTFISSYSKAAWGVDGDVINHGLDTDFWCKDLNLNRSDDILSVVNFWANRDWACGWELYKQIKNIYNGKYEVLGNNPGLSVPAKSINYLRASYNMCGVFLNTSLFSPIPMSLLEAMACGSPVVSTNTCMIPSIIKHGYNGLIANDPKELSEYLNFMLNNKHKALEMGQNAKNTIIEHFNINEFIKNWNISFKKVLIK